MEGGRPRNLECLSKKDLQQRAKTKDIKGRSKMNKAQLVEAVRNTKSKSKAAKKLS